MLLLALLAVVVGVNAGAPLPDLTIDRQHLIDTLTVDTQFYVDECLVDGGCLPSIGKHTLLRFATRTHNIAPEGGDLLIGSPPPPPTVTVPVTKHTMSDNGIKVQWEWHPCHLHYHMIGYVLAQLFDAGDMSEAAVSQKHSFSIRDTACTRQGVTPKFTSSHQGITAGCHDTYSVTTTCQWVAVDDLPVDKDYILRLTVDPFDFIPESNNTNNVIEVPVRLDDFVSAASAVRGIAAWAGAVAVYLFLF
jgi:hypothetical protein